MKPRMREDDVELLLPSFREATKKLLSRLQALGYDPCPFDTLRTPAEALRNAKRGKGIMRSVHLTGAAVDTICHLHLWSCFAKGCHFFTDKVKVAEELGMVSGSHFRRVDWPHDQGVLVSEQDELFALRPEDRDAFVAASLARRLR